MNKKLKRYTWIFIVISVATYFIVPFLLTLPNPFGLYFSELTSPIGDTIGGILGPIVGFAGVLLTFYAFYIQYEANENQKQQFLEQKNDLKIERFENNFFELINIHRANISEISIDGCYGNVNSRKAFISMFNEFRACYHITTKVFTDIRPDNITREDLMNISFVLFMTGVGENSDIVSKNYLNNYNESFINSLKEELLNTKLLCKEDRKSNYVLNYEALGNLPKLSIYLKYMPFGGHYSRLDHYFRNIYTTISILDDEDFKQDTKHKYASLFRAQVSSYEQLMLFYYDKTIFMDNAKYKTYLDKYNLTENMPEGLNYL